MILNLGVVDVPYSRGETGQTTGDVAEILESKYEVMNTFASLHIEDIKELARISVEEKIKAVLAGAPSRGSPYRQAEDDIRRLFRAFLSEEEMNGAADVPTQAALNGVNHRLKRPYVKRGARPSFIDTGLYQASFVAWVENE